MLLSHASLTFKSVINDVYLFLIDYALTNKLITQALTSTQVFVIVNAHAIVDISMHMFVFINIFWLDFHASEFIELNLLV